MDERIKFYVALDLHKESISIAAAERGREAARFVGTIGPNVHSLFRILAKAGDPAQF
ncbi:MAG: IS110 family transposase, partial [Rhizobacter sp.]|nr:IS110 family transposase [Rhizobacter sp.]